MDASKTLRSLSNLSNAGRIGTEKASEGNSSNHTSTPSPEEQTTAERLLNQPDLYTRLFGRDSPGTEAPGSATGNDNGQADTAGDQNPLMSRLAGQAIGVGSFGVGQTHLNPLLAQLNGPTPAQTVIDPDTTNVVDDIVEEVLAEDDINYRPELLATRIKDLDANTQAQVISEILEQSNDALTDITDPLAVTPWLEPGRLNALHDMGLLSGDSQTVLANAYAAAWNRDLIPEGLGPGGLRGSMLDNFGFARNADDFVDFFNAGTTSEVREFRISYAGHLNDTYVQTLDGVNAYADQYSDNAALVAARLVTDPGVPQSVALEFYEQNFGSGQRSEFIEFLESAVSNREDDELYWNENESYDPFVAFSRVAQVPSTYDIHFDNSRNGSREALAIDLSFAVGRAEANGGFRGINYGGVLEGSEERRLARLESAVEVFEDHGTAILDGLSEYTNITFDNAGQLQRAHPELVGFFAHTIGNTDLSNRTTARDVAQAYFDRQIDVINQNDNAGDPETVAERRAIAIGSAAGLATQDIRADQQSVVDARRAALEFAVDTALSLIPIGKGATAARNALSSTFGSTVPDHLISELANELINSGGGQLTAQTRELLLDTLIRNGGGGGTVAAGQEFLDLTVNPLGIALEIEDGLLTEVDGIPGHVEEAYLRIIAKTKTTIGLDN